MAWIFVSLFGLLGVLSRFGLDTLGKARGANPLHVTFSINVIGCVIAALIYIATARKTSLPTPILQGAMAGFCGGFTTFSAYALQAVTLIESGKILPAVIYLLASPVAGVAAIITTLLFFK